MFKKKIELIKSINYPEDTVDNQTFCFDLVNGVYRSLIRLFEAFWNKYKKELYLVGGCCRDLLLGKKPKDYDLTTNASIEEIRSFCNELGLKTFDSGVKHGTLTIIDDFFKMSYELTVYRKDGKYSDNRHPDSVEFVSNLEEDLKRRDFTINSFAYNLLTQELVMLDESFFYDLELGVIRCVGDPNKRFEEDALRMLRAIRFAAQLGFNIEKNTYEAIKENSFRLRDISRERIRDELTKILLSDSPQMLEHFCLTGLEYWAFATNGGWTPIKAMLECTQHNKYHYTDVFHHTIDVVKKCSKDFNVRWAALLHDIGKPLDKTVDEEGWEHFYNHAEKSVHIATALMDILKFSNDQKDIITKFVKWHDYPLSQVNNKKFKQLIVEIGEENFPNFLKLKEADASAHLLSASTEFAIDAVSKCKDRFRNYLINKPPVTLRDLAINGNDLIEMGFQGPEIGKILHQLLEVVLDNPELNDKQHLLDIVLTGSKANDIMDKDKEE